MNYASPELLEELAAEYALGTLRGRARLRFERLLTDLPMTRQALAGWERCLSGLTEGQGVYPPAGSRDALMRAVAPVVIPLRPRRRRWQWTMAASLAAVALTAAFFVGRHSGLGARQTIAKSPMSAPTHVAATTLKEAGDAPHSFLAELHMPSSSMGWLLGMSPDSRQISAVAADDLLTLGRRRAELWLKLPNGDMTALGALPLERDAVALYDLPAHVRGQNRVIFAITLEPDSKPQTQRPSAPVLATVPSVDAI